MKKGKIILIFSLLLVVSLPVLFLQSRTFAQILTNLARDKVLQGLGVDGGFEELAVKVFPPGITIKKPSITFKEVNSIGLPDGTHIQANNIELTFQLFQLLTGIVNINGVVFSGADLKLNLDKEFFRKLDERKAAERKSKLFKKKNSEFSLEQILSINFKSVGLTESNLEILIEVPNSNEKIRFKTIANELTIGKGFSGGGQGLDFGFDLGNTSFSGFGVTQDLSMLRASLGLTSNNLQIRSFAVQDSQRSLYVNGDVKGNIFEPKNLPAELSISVRGPVQDWLNDRTIAPKLALPKKMQVVEGMLKLNGKTKFDFKDIANTIEAQVELETEDLKYELWKTKQISLKIEYKKNELQAKQLDVIFEDDGKLKVDSFTLDPSKLNSDLRVGVNVHFDQVDLHQALGTISKEIYPLRLQLNGDVKTEVFIPKRSPKQGATFDIAGNSDLIVRKFSLDNQHYGVKKPLKTVFSIPEMKINAGFNIRETGFYLDQALVKLPHSEMIGTGSVTVKDGFDLSIESDKVDLKDIGKLAVFDLEGEGKLNWTVKGKPERVLFTFYPELKDARYLNLNMGDVKGEAVYDDDEGTIYFRNLAVTQGKLVCVGNGSINLSTTDDVNMNIKVPSGTVQDFAKVFSRFIQKAIPWYPNELMGQIRGDIDLTGKTDMDLLSVMGDFELENLDYNYEIFRKGKMRAGYRKGAFVAENIQMQKKNGWFYGNVVYGADNILRYDVRSDGLSTTDIDRLGMLDIPYRAGLTLTSQGVGPIDSLKSSTYFRIENGTVKNSVIPGSEMSILTENGRMKAKGSSFGDTASLSLDYGFAKGASSSFEGSLRNFNFLPILVILNPTVMDSQNITSEVNGNTKFTFRTGDLNHLTGNFLLNNYRLTRPGNSLGLAKPVSIDVKDGQYHFSQVEFRGDDTEIMISGKVENDVIQYDANGSLNLRLFELIVPEIQSLVGRANFSTSVKGPIDSPLFKTKASVVDSELKLRSLAQSFEDIRYEVDWTNSTMKVNDIYSKFAGGKIFGSGKVELYSNKVPDLDFYFTLNNPKIQVYPVNYARLNGKMEITGKELPYKAKGSLVIAEALVRENFNSKDSSKLLRSSKFLPASKGGGAGEFQLFEMDIDLYADKAIFVKNDLFDGEVRGKLKIINTIKSPRVMGNVGIINGKLLFKDSYFAIQSGSLRFTNPAVIDPEFDISGNTEMKGYKIYLIATGKTSDYQLSFQSQPQLSQNDIVNLLTLGVTSSGFENLARGNKDAYTKEEMYGLIFNQSSLNKGLQEKLGVKLSLDQSRSLTPESIFRAQSNDIPAAASPKVVVQKQVTKNLSASAGTTVGLGDSRQQSLDLEYDVGRNWSVLGIYEDQRGAQPQNSRTSLGADVKFKLRFK